MCKELLFSEGYDGEAFIFAQCVNIPFWKFNLSETNEARALVFQLNAAFPSYQISDGCTSRSTSVWNDKDGGLRFSPAPCAATA